MTPVTCTDAATLDLGSRSRPAASRAERGRIMVLLVGLMSVLLALVLVITGATSLHLERKRLLGLTDAAAAHAADAVDHSRYYVQERGDEDVPLSDASVRAAVEEYVRGAPPSVRERLAGVRIARPTGSPDGRTAEVTLSARLRPAILPAEMWEYLDGIEVQVTSTARAYRR